MNGNNWGSQKISFVSLICDLVDQLVVFRRQGELRCTLGERMQFQKLDLSQGVRRVGPKTTSEPVLMYLKVLMYNEYRINHHTSFSSYSRG